jgi:hypothetical protein
MAYTPNAEDTAQPTGNQALSTAALEFRTLKQYVQTTKTAQAAATALVASNLAAALVTQDTRDDAQDTAISTAQSTAGTALATAITAISTAITALATRVTTLSGSGNYTVPAGVTQIVVVMQGGSTGKGRAQATSGYGQFAFYMDSVAGEVVAKKVNVTPGQIIPYSVGVGGYVDVVGNGGMATLEETISASSSTFGSLEAKINCPRYGYSAGGYNTEANTIFVSHQARYDRRFTTIHLGYVTGTSGNTLDAGEAGSIHLFY